MLVFGDWWHSLSSWQQLFWSGAIVGSVLLIIRTILSLIDEEKTTPSLWNTSNILTFFTFFFWTGIILFNLKLGLDLVLLASIFVGVLIVVIVHYILGEEQEVFSREEIIEHTAKVQTVIPPHQEGHGRVQIEIRGTLLELDAITIGNELPFGVPVMVIDIVNQRTLLVEAIPNPSINTSITPPLTP